MNIKGVFWNYNPTGGLFMNLDRLTKTKVADSRRWGVYVRTAACILSACGTQLGFNIWANSIKDKFELSQTQGKNLTLHLK